MEFQFKPPGTLKKINLGCGTNALPGWENHDIDVDITKTLPWPPNSADAVFAEHTVEHTTMHQAYTFFAECYRILKPGGRIRITVPCVTQVDRLKTPAYIQFLHSHGWGDGTPGSAVRAILFCHGHQSVWTHEVLASFLTSVGFKNAEPAQLYTSRHEVFKGVEGHHRVIGVEFNNIESISVEAEK